MEDPGQPKINIFFKKLYIRSQSYCSQVALVVKNLPANAGDMRHEFDL